MSNRRKPLPLATDERNDDPFHGEAPQQSPTQQSTPADPRLTRYSLTDTPQQPPPSNGAYDSITLAVNQLLQRRYSAVEDPNTEQWIEDVAPVTGPDIRPASELSQLSGATVVDPQEHHIMEKLEEDERKRGINAPAQPPSQSLHPTGYTSYQPGQFLPTVFTGESLQMDELQQPLPVHPNSSQDPFSDSMVYAASDLQPYSTHYEQPEYAHSPSRPLSSHSYKSTFIPPHSDQNTPMYQPEVLPAGSFVDHFKHDTEAYASGSYSRGSFRPPRSRSPTPAVDDEDYHIVGDDSVHYTGAYPQYPSDPSSYYDPEKPLDEHGNYIDGQYVYEYVQDPEWDGSSEKTPASSLNEPETPVETRHFGPAPTGRVLRRHKTKKRVQLTNGNLVVDVNVPPKLVLPRKGEEETMKTRYTAVTCDPDEFEKKGFFLRQNENGRRTELFIVITMYNVSFLVLLAATTR